MTHDIAALMRDTIESARACAKADGRLSPHMLGYFDGQLVAYARIGGSEFAGLVAEMVAELWKLAKGK